MRLDRLALGAAAFLAGPLLAASMNFSGHFRASTAYYNKLDLSLPGTNNAQKTYITGRALLEPNLVIDDHFNLKSQWSLLATANNGNALGMTTPPANASLRPGQGGFIFGDNNTPTLLLSRAWLEWTSDFGVLKIGRMPFSWGYGLIWDQGNKVWDDWQTTLDRIEYRLHLGHVIGGIAYSKQMKGSVLGATNDADFYSVYLQYDNPEVEVEAGILYERQTRSSSQQDALMNKPFVNAGVGAQSGLYDRALELGMAPGSLTPYPLSNHVVDVYVKKTIRYFTFGGEVSWIGGDAVDFNSDNAPDSLNAFGIAGNVAYEAHSLKIFLDFLYASGDGNLNDNSLSGFVLLHRNRHPGLILGRELLGTLHGNHVGLGSLVAYGTTGSYSGTLFFRPGVRIDWSQDWSTGLEVILAYKAAVAAGEPRSLGVEFDLGAEHVVYENCTLGAAAALLLPGRGLQNASSAAFALRATLGVVF